MKNIFVSSTFRDMQAERDLVQEEVLPQLRNKAKSYGENINMIDLRWGVDTSELESEAGSMKVMSVCLDEVERSKPYMLIFLGERYGSIIEPAITKRVIERKNNNFALDDYAISITAMEVEFGALSEQFGSLENCVVCMRNFSAETIADESDGAVYRAENEELDKKQKAFKERVVTKLQGQVIEYTCSWNEEKKQLVDFKTLEGKPLSEKLIETYESMFQQEWKKHSELSWQDKEQLAADVLMESKLRTFYGRERLIDEYYKKLTGEDKALILQGEVGCGKTSILCKLAEKLQQDGKKVFRFFAGNSPMSETMMQLMQQVTYFLENILGVKHSEGKDLCRYKNIVDIIDWEKHFKKLTEQLDSDEKIYFVLDGLDLLEDWSENLREVARWSHGAIKVVVSCTKEIKEDSFVLEEHLITVEQILALNEQDAKDVIEGILSASSKNAYKEIQQAILEKKNAANPLYISMLLQRLNMMGLEDLYHARTERDIVCHSREIIEQIPDEVGAAADYIIKEAIRRLDIDKQEISDVVNMLAVSRNGLREEDIVAISAALGHHVSQLDISRLIYYLDTFFVIRQNGRIDFANRIIRQGVCENADENRYIDAIAARIKSLECEDELWQSEGLYYAQLKKDLAWLEKLLVYAGESISEQRMEAAVIREGMADNGELYCKVMEQIQDVKPLFFFVFLSGNSLEEGRMLERVNEKLVTRMEEKYRNGQEGHRAMTILYEWRSKYTMEGPEAELAYIRKNLEVRKTMYEEALKEEELHPSYLEPSYVGHLMAMAECYDNMSYILKELGRREEGLEARRNAIKMREKLCESGEDMAGLAYHYEKMGEELIELGEVEEAIVCYKKALEIREKCKDETKNEVFEWLDSQGDNWKWLASQDDDWKQLALKYDNVGKLLKNQGKAEEAFLYYKRALELREPYCESSRDLMLLYVNHNNLGNTLKVQEKWAEALGYYRKGLEIAERVYSNTEAIENMADMALLCCQNCEMFFQLSQLEEASRYFKETEKLLAQCEGKASPEKLALVRAKMKELYEAYLK